MGLAGKLWYLPKCIHENYGHLIRANIRYTKSTLYNMANSFFHQEYMCY
uniref:Uncharacterized protein n=1 Tax=Tetranychus urticae TaxID=32264 RepID=T1KHE1_TETUR